MYGTSTGNQFVQIEEILTIFGNIDSPCFGQMNVWWSKDILIPTNWLLTYDQFTICATWWDILLMYTFSDTIYLIWLCGNHGKKSLIHRNFFIKYAMCDFSVNI